MGLRLSYTRPVLWPLALAVSLVASNAAFADALERFQPLPPQAPAKAIITIETPLQADDTPIGPALSALVVTMDGTEDMPVEVSGQAFVGQPISPRLIHEVITEITRQYSQSGHPVMAQWVPEKDMSSGVLTIRVADLVIGGVTVKGAKPNVGAYIKKRLALSNGQTVDARRFALDIENLNKYPYRQVAATFKPNAENQTSDLDLVVTESKPWEGYIGYRTTSSEGFTWRRYVAGLTVGNVLGRDSVLSAQAIASPDFVLHGNTHPKYKDIIISYVIPLSKRVQFEASIDDGELNFRFNGTHYRFVDVMTAWGLRQDISAHYPTGTSADIRYGIEAKNEQANFQPANAPVNRLSAEVYQAYFGYHIARDTDTRHTDFDLIARLSPGGMGAGNSDRQAERISEGRITSAQYAYVSLTYELIQSLGKTWVWHNQIIGVWASKPIPFSEQPGIGGPGLVRGYYLFDGSFDSALVMRNELGLRAKPGSQALPSPYLILDMGTGYDLVLKRSSTIASTGVGARLKLTPQTALRLEAIHDLRKGDATPDGSDALGAYLMVTF